MPDVVNTQDTRSQIARKVNFAIQLLREAAELLEASDNRTPTRRPRYPRRSNELDEQRLPVSPPGWRHALFSKEPTQ